MAASRICRASDADLLFVLLFLSLSTGVVRAQPQPLAPTSNVTIVVPSGPLHYSSIHIPAGVRVRFVAPGLGAAAAPNMPAIVHCDGDAIVHGMILVVGDWMSDRPAGWVTTGAGQAGVTCGGTVYEPPEGGRHSGSYGSVLPFSLQGGSDGGGVVYKDATCNQNWSSFPGGEGGGTLVLLAGGRIEVHGWIAANGDHGGLTGSGSGGSILLRGENGVEVFPGGSVTAPGGNSVLAPSPWPSHYSFGADGYIRLDAWGAPPVIHGTVDPAPTVLALPHIRAVSPPTIGTTWMLDVFAPDTAWVYVVGSLAPAAGSPMTPFGPLGLDLATAAGIALTTPQASHDPVASVSWPIPNVPTLVGLPLWFQAIAVPPNLPARLTNTLAVVVQ